MTVDRIIQWNITRCHHVPGASLQYETAKVNVIRAALACIQPIDPLDFLPCQRLNLEAPEGM